MAGKAPSRLKSERAHTSKPYEKPKSILTTVAAKVKDILLPSWLTEGVWSFNPEGEEPEREDGRYVPETEDVTRHDERDEASEGGLVVSTFSRRDTPFEATREGYDCSFVPRGEPVRIPSASTPVPSTSRVADGPALLNGDNHSENSEGSGSTSGCSSLVPSTRARDAASTPAQCTMTGLTLSEAALERLRRDLTSRRDFGITADLPPQSSSARDTGQNNLWSNNPAVDTTAAQPHTSASGSTRPSFTLSTFSSPSGGATKRKADTQYKSLFYEGRTTYGGAAAYRKFNLVNTSGPYGQSRLQPEESLAVSSQKRRRKDDDFLCMSNTTKRILESLEKASTPLSEAKKVPLNRGTQDPILRYVPFNQRRHLALREISATPSARGPPSTSLSRPIPVRLEKNLDSILAPKSTAASGASTSTPSVSCVPAVTREVVPVSYPMESPSREETGGGGKMRVQVVPHQRPSARHRRTEDEEVLQVPDLPSIPLPLTTLPSFNFRPPLASSTPAPAKTTAAPSSAPLAKPPKSDECAGSEFQFSAPVYQEGLDVPATTSAPPLEFNFSEPVVMKPGDGAAEGQALNSFAPSAATSVKRKAPGMTEPTTTDSSGGFRPASQLILGGSVMDILSKTSTRKSESSDSVDAASSSPAQGQSEKPAGSEHQSGSTPATSTPLAMSRPVTTTTAVTPATTTTSGWGDKFKPDPLKWHCDTCLIENSQAVTRCMACEAPRPVAAPKPGAAPSTKPCSVTATTAPTGFGNLFKPPAGSWACGACMLQNHDASAIKCIACETPRPGAAAGAAGAAGPPQGCTTTAFKFGTSSASTTASTTMGLTFGISSGSATASTTTGFKFGITSSSTASTPSSGTAVKVGFPVSSSQTTPPPIKFGVPATSTTSAASVDTTVRFKFGVQDAHKQPAVASKASSGPAYATDSAAAKITTNVSTSESSFAKGGISSFVAPTSSTGFKFARSDSSNVERTDGPDEVPAKKAVQLFSFGGSTVASPSPFGSALQKPESPARGIRFGIPTKTDLPGTKAELSAPAPKKAVSVDGFSFTSPASKAAPLVAPATSTAQSAESAAGMTPFRFGVPSSKPAEGNAVGGFTFSGAAKRSDNAKDAGFMFGNTGTSTVKNGFLFGAPTTEENVSTNKGGFSLGAVPPSGAVGGEAAKGGFSFNAGPKKDDAAKGGFVFGGAAPPVAKTTFAFGVQQSSEPASSAPAGGPKFVFGQKSDVPPGTFTFGAASPASQPAATTTTASLSSLPAFGFKQVVPAGAATSQPATPFGAKTETPSTTPFGFGGTPSVVPSPAAPAVFSFGAPKSDPAPAAPQPAAAGFSFGASAPSQAPAAAAAAPPSAQPAFSFGASQPASTTPQMFKFGTASPAPAPTPFGSATPSAQPGAVAPPAANTGFSFSAAAASPFGASQSQAAATASPFGASQPQATASTPQFGAAQGQSAPGLFGSSTGQAAGAPAAGFSFRPAAPAAASAFQFGGAAPGSQEVFRFGAQAQSQEAQPQQPGTFNFNPPVAGTVPVFGQQMAPSFNFNAAAPAVPPAGFQFQANTENPFSATGSGALAGRKIRKAVRRKPTTQR